MTPSCLFIIKKEGRLIYELDCHENKKKNIKKETDHHCQLQEHTVVKTVLLTRVVEEHYDKENLQSGKRTRDRIAFCYYY